MSFLIIKKVEVECAFRVAHLRSLLGMLVWGSLFTSSLVGCDDRSDAVGFSLMPDYTKVEAETAVLPLSYRTISAGSLGGRLEGITTDEGITFNNIFVNSAYAYLGSIPNSEFGEVKSEYLTQFYVPAGFKFAQEVYQNKIDSAFITLYVNGYTGDGTQPMSVEAYRLSKPLPLGDKYSVGDVAEYTESATLLGRVSYTASAGAGEKVNNATVVKIPLETSFGQKLYDMSQAGDGVFQNQSAFDSYFPGVYLRNGAGKGSILRVARTALTLYYQTKNPNYDAQNPKEGVNEYITGVQELSHTSEVPQISRYGNFGLDKLLARTAESSNMTYIKAPAGVFTEITIPTTVLKSKLEAEPGFIKEINGAPLTIVGEASERNAYLLDAPSNLLLLPKDSVQTFFEKEFTELDERLTSYVSTTTIQGSATYTFGNIAALIVEHLKSNPNEDLTVVLVPIERTLSQVGQGATTTGSISTSISNQVMPSAVKFRVDDPLNQSLSLVITKRLSGDPF